ncbi:hypothetical protein ACWGUN_31755 [Streptomyces koyangensis]|uniref:hypothetical protein n=1 Tax=Streptomyces koyangensis TaxID=188770 RepID=UPI00339A7ABA
MSDTAECGECRTTFVTSSLTTSSTGVQERGGGGESGADQLVVDRYARPCHGPGSDGHRHVCCSA